jgi:hypothetical protein
MLGRSERFIIDAIATGKIKAVKSDRRTLLVCSRSRTTSPRYRRRKEPRTRAVV